MLHSVQVLEEAQKDLVNYKGTGMSIMEMSHRGKEYEAVQKKAEADLRQLLNIPSNYKVLFLQGEQACPCGMHVSAMPHARIVGPCLKGQLRPAVVHTTSVFSRARGVFSVLGLALGALTVSNGPACHCQLSRLHALQLWRMCSPAPAACAPLTTNTYRTTHRTGPMLMPAISQRQSTRPHPPTHDTSFRACIFPH